MVRTSQTRIGATILGVLVATGVAAEPPALTITSASIRPDADGYVYCVVVATAHKPIDMATSLVTASGADVTGFGSSLRASPLGSEDGRYHAEDGAGTFDDGESHCRVVVNNLRRQDISVVVTSHDQNGIVLASAPNP